VAAAVALTHQEQAALVVLAAVVLVVIPLHLLDKRVQQVQSIQAAVAAVAAVVKLLHQTDRVLLVDLEL
jgi:hypothetical protein